MRLIILSFVFIFSVNGFSQNFATIDVDSCYNLIQANHLNPDFIILDVRTINDYNIKHLENAVMKNYYDSDFNATLDTLIKTKTYLIHCASGGRSGITFNTMQTLGFTDVYNMSGGINAWVAAGYSTTTVVNPILLPVSDTIADFVDIDLSTSQTVELTITNYANDTLKFTNISDLSSTEFTTNFNLNRELTGFMDYTFSVDYSPIDLIDDSVVFTIESNGGNIEFVLKGNASPTYTTNLSSQTFKLYPNPAKDLVWIKNIKENNSDVQLADITGKKISQFKTQNSEFKIDLSNLQTGIYFIKIGNSVQKLIKE